MNEQQISNMTGKNNFEHYQFFTMLVAATFVILASLLISGILPSNLSPVKPKLTDGQIVAKYTGEILDQNDQYQKKPDNKKAKVLEKMVATSQVRKLAMANLIKENPAQALALSMPADQRETLPSQVQENVEKEVTVQGMLEVSHIDDFENKREIPFNTLFTEDRELLVYSTERILREDSGSVFEMTGVQLTGSIALDNGHSKNIRKISDESSVLGLQTGQDSPNAAGSVLAEASTNLIRGLPTTGNLKILVLRYQYLDASCASEALIRTIFNQLDAYIREASYGRAQVTTDISACIRVPFTITSPLSEKDRLRIADQTINLTNYPYFASIRISGGQASAELRNYYTKDGLAKFATFSTSLNINVAAHEFGHVLGHIEHANQVYCSGVNPLISFRSSCNFSSNGYGNWYSAMDSQAGHYDAYHKEKMGWFDASNVIEVTAPGTYTIEPYETTSTAPKIIKIPRRFEPLENPAGKQEFNWFYIEYRRPIGFDAALSGVSFDGAVVIWARKIIDGVEDTQLLGLLGDGRTFNDGITGIRITNTARTSNSLTIRVDSAGSLPAGPNCLRNPPKVQVDPTIQSGKRGQTL